MKTQSAPLVVAGEAIALPLIVIEAEVVARIESLMADAAALKIENAADAQRADRLFGEIHGLMGDIEVARETHKKPFWDIGKRIDTAVKAEAAKLQRAKDAVKARMNSWDDHCRELARQEQERQRKAAEELARQLAAAEKAKKDAEEAKRLADEAAAAADAPPPDDEDDLGALLDEVAVEDAEANHARIAQQAAQLAQSRTVLAPVRKFQNATMRTTLKFTVADVRRLPTSLVTITANETEIRRVFCVGWKEGDPLPSVPGLVFSIDRNAVPTGRR